MNTTAHTQKFAVRSVYIFLHRFMNWGGLTALNRFSLSLIRGLQAIYKVKRKKPINSLLRKGYEESSLSSLNTICRKKKSVRINTLQIGSHKLIRERR